MGLVSVASVTLRPECFGRYEELVQELADAAIRKQESWRWTTHQVAFGRVGLYHFVSRVPDFKSIQQHGQVHELTRRVLGEKRGSDLFQEANACTLGLRQTISRERPDLSYLEQPEPRLAPASLVTQLSARPGRHAACETLLRKLAEAIPKVGEATQLIVFQILVGNPRVYWSVRPLESLGELDDQQPPAGLLQQAFGPAEGGVALRRGGKALAALETSLTLYREDLSNPPDPTASR